MGLIMGVLEGVTGREYPLVWPLSMLFAAGRGHLLKWQMRQVGEPAAGPSRSVEARVTQIGGS